MSARIRGIIYFLFLTGFLISAPLVVLYTAGYRYSFADGRVVQTGVLSATSLPKGASVSIDGELQESRTPVVLDNVLPGEHVIRIWKDGYSSWEKTLEISSRDTTFIKDVLLFLQREPLRLRSVDVLAVSHAPQGQKTAFALQEEDWLELWVFDSSDESETLLARVPSDSTSNAEISWSANGTYLSVLLRSASTRLYSIIDTRDVTSSSIEALVPGAVTGSWDTMRDNIYFATTESSVWEIDLATKTSVLLFDAPILVSSDGTDLITAESIEDRTVISRRQGELVSILAYIPLGSYTFHPSTTGTLLLEDTQRHRIIVLDSAGGDQPILLNADANIWKWEPAGRRLLYSNGFDLHIYDPNAHSDETLTRVSEQITGLAWYPEPKSVVLFSQREALFAIELDRRNSRNITTLALGTDFQNVWVDEKGRVAYFFGTIAEETGLYARPLQR